MATHTPGPWESNGSCYVRKYTPEGIVVDIALVATEADARLIAAAPELLAFAKKAHVCFGVPVTDCETCKMIAKAEGRS